MHRKLLFAATFFAAMPFAHADSNATPLEIVVTTGTRTEQPLDQSINDTTVITSQDIQNVQATDVATLLKRVAGIEIVQSGGIGEQSSLFIRGTNSDHVLVLVDGVRIDSATTGATALDQLMPDQIDHIEIVRGNASSLYGSSAIGGVIQIFTRQGTGKPAFNASLGAGSFNTQRASAGFGGQSGNTNFDLQVSRFRTDGVSAINSDIIKTANPDKDGYDNNSFSAKVRQALNADNSISASVFQSLGHTQFDNAYNAATTDRNTSSSRLGTYSLASDNQLTNLWHSKLQLSQGTDESTTYLNGNPDPYGSYYRTINHQISWQNNLVLDASNTLLAGAERLHQQVSSDTAYTHTQRTDNALFGGYTGNFESHQAQINLRRDNYSDFGGATTGLLGYGYRISPSWRITASYSTAFKAPTFNDLYAPASWGSNPNLQPERSRNYEAGLHYAGNNQSVDLVYFDNVINNLIAYNSGYTLANINRARINGEEMHYTGQFGANAVRAELTSQNPRDTATNQLLLRRAMLFGNLGLSHQIGSWRLGGEWLYSGKRQDSYTDPSTFTTSRVTLPSYNVFNLVATYAVGKNATLSLQADNLTNQNDSGIYGYNSLGRRLFAGLSYRQ